VEGGAIQGAEKAGFAWNTRARQLSIVPSLRDSSHRLILPGTPVPGYRLFRPYGTASFYRATAWGEVIRSC
jgi:hypothetical protein